MLNVIIVKSCNSKLINVQKIRKGCVIYETDNGTKFRAKDFIKERILIQCNECDCLKEVTFYTQLLKRKYLCHSCLSSGTRNPFYGRKHTEEHKRKSSQEKKGKFAGESNPFYGKKHSAETRAIISKKLIENGSCKGEKNSFYGRKHTPETLKKLSEKSKKWADAHPEHYIMMGTKSIESQRKGYKTSIEIKVENELIRMGLTHKYNKILNGRQYDFVIGRNILLEVQGDFWHANPLYYGDGKKKLSERQIFKVGRDQDKREFAESIGYKVFYIWETEINNDDFSVLENIKRSYYAV